MDGGTLRATPVLSAWAAVNQLALPVLPEGPPPYTDSITDRPSSSILVSTI